MPNFSQGMETRFLARDAGGLSLYDTGVPSRQTAAYGPLRGLFAGHAMRGPNVASSQAGPSQGLTPKCAPHVVGQTRALLRKSVTLSLGSDGIVENRIWRTTTGLVAEVHLQVNESVEGFTIGSTRFLYKDLRAENPNMSRKQRDFRTTGVIVRIDEPWFAGTKGQNPHIREQVAKGLLGLISRDRSIAPQDVDATHSNIALITESGPRRLTDAIVIYDSVYGGLRLAEDLFLEFTRYIEQLGKAADLAGVDAIVSEDTAKRLETWAKGLGAGNVDPTVSAPRPDGWYQIYRPGSIVSVLFNGNFVERELLEPKLADPIGTGTPTLFYSYRVNTGSGVIPHDQVQATGQDWSWVYWNPETGEYQELDQGEQSPAPS
jgi:DEAD/DEAH box helicase domain-containing protein